MTDLHYMKRALALARQGSGWVNPNPQVGAVVVSEGKIIAEGYHRKYGDLHAERAAINSCEQSLLGATLYVTLEPCCHTGKTPPCTEAIIASGISSVVIGSDDPNPYVAGVGIARLRAAGIKVETGFMKQECDALNHIFFHYIQNKTPYVLLKYAMTLDGKIATRTGASKWITGEKARADVQELRGRYAAIMVGIGTVLADDPLLTCRIKGERTPLRVICDSQLRIPLESQIIQTAADTPTLIATTSSDEKKAQQLRGLGCDVVQLPAKNKRIDLVSLMELLGQRETDSVLIEGGAAMHGAALDAGIVQAVRCYIAPKLFGGHDAPSPVGGQGVTNPIEALVLRNTTIKTFGDDICIEGEVR